ncbi:MAG: asparaginase [Spirochaetes bacterium]|nr:asparaginase [Spirochaetota bacterium]
MKILLITTGGTIVSEKGLDGEGLAPSKNGAALFEKLFEASGINGQQSIPGSEARRKLGNLRSPSSVCREMAEIEICSLFLKDSSNINPDDWILIIKKIFENKDLFDGFIITHGTDTMAYTSSILSYVLGALEKPVILTGSMIPATWTLRSAPRHGCYYPGLVTGRKTCKARAKRAPAASHPESDAKYNLVNSFKFMRVLIEKGQGGVSICFNGKLMHGTRVKKIDSATWMLRPCAAARECAQQNVQSTSKASAGAAAGDAFVSVSYDDIGVVTSGNAEITAAPFIDKVGLARFGESFSFNTIDSIRFERNIISLKLFPGFSADYFGKILDIKPLAIIIESFGAGGLPFMGENLLPMVEQAQLLDIIVVVSAQCLKGGVDLSLYEVGQRAAEAGAVSAHDMTYEAAVTKLMWLLAQVPAKKAKELFVHNFCDELSLPKFSDCREGHTGCV